MGKKMPGFHIKKMKAKSHHDRFKLKVENARWERSHNKKGHHGHGSGGITIDLTQCCESCCCCGCCLICIPEEDKDGNPNCCYHNCTKIVWGLIGGGVGICILLAILLSLDIETFNNSGVPEVDKNYATANVASLQELLTKCPDNHVINKIKLSRFTGDKYAYEIICANITAPNSNSTLNYKSEFYDLVGELESEAAILKEMPIECPKGFGLNEIQFLADTDSPTKFKLKVKGKCILVSTNSRCNKIYTERVYTNLPKIPLSYLTNTKFDFKPQVSTGNQFYLGGMKFYFKQVFGKQKNYQFYYRYLQCLYY